MVKEDWAPYQHPQTGPRPRRFLLRSFSTSGPHRLYLLVARPTFYSNLLVSTCSLLYLPSHFVQLLFLSFRSLFLSPPSSVSSTSSRWAPPVRMPATFGAPREWASMFHSPRQQNEPPRRQLIFQEATSASAVMYTRDIHSHTYRHGVVRAFIDFVDRRGFKFSDGDRKSRAQESRASAPFMGF